MNRRNFAILALVAVILAVLAIVGQRRNDTASIAGESAGTLLLPALAGRLDAVGQVLIDGGGDKRLVTLERTDDAWSVDERDGYPADTKKLNALLIALSEARIVEEKTANPDFYSRLGVEAIDNPDAGGLRLTLVADDDQYAVVLGDAYGNDERYARLPESERSVLVDKNPDVSRDPSDWVLKQIVSVAGKRVQRVEIMHADGERLVIRKESPDETNFTVDNIPEGRELQYASIGNVTGTVLQDLQLEAVARRADDRPEPDVVSKFFTFDGLVVTASAASMDDDEHWLTFNASFDPDQAAAFAPTTPAEDASASDDDEAAAGGDEAAEADSGAADAPGPDIAAEAAMIDARVDGWQYRIPSYQYSQMTRRMEDLLKAPAESDE
jgi:hypothetical protein